MFVTLGKLQSSGTNWRCLIQKSYVSACLCALKLNISQRLHPLHSGNPDRSMHLIQNGFRRCDSRNLNLSPVCNFSSTTGPFYWKSKVSEVYRKIGEVPEYIEKKEDTARSYYPDNYLRTHEMITSLVEVIFNPYVLA